MKSNRIKFIIIALITSIALINITACKSSTKEESVQANTVEDKKENVEAIKETTPLDGMKETDLKNVGKLSMFLPTAESKTLVEAVSNKENIKWYFTEKSEYACSFDYKGHNIIIKMTNTSIDMYDNNKAITEEFADQVAGHLFGEDCSYGTIKSAIGSQENFSKSKGEKLQSNNTEDNYIQFADMAIISNPINNEQRIKLFENSTPKDGMAIATQQIIKAVNGQVVVEKSDNKGFYITLYGKRNFEEFRCAFYCSVDKKIIYLVAGQKKDANSSKAQDLSAKEAKKLLY